MIRTVETHDMRFPLKEGAGSDAIHRDPVYSYAVTLLRDDSGVTGTGLAFTLGEGNDLVCRACDYLAKGLAGRNIEEVMAEFGRLQHALSNEQQFRWLGPHKGVVHLALASLTNACWDLWAKKRRLPLWKLLLELSPEELVATLDLSCLEEELTAPQAAQAIRDRQASRSDREEILEGGYPGYDTSVGWFNYSDEAVRENCWRAVDAGFTALKLKVGSTDADRDIRRAHIVREIAGADVRVMVDANQQWNLPTAVAMCRRLREIDPYWIEEPLHPDDTCGHRTLADAIGPTKLALGEHVPNRVIFKNYLQMKCAGFIQVDALRVAGVSEFLAVSLLCRKHGIPVVPHVGDMGQLHQHLVLFNRIALDHEVIFLEHIPHLREHFQYPARLEGGVYQTPQEPGSSTGLQALSG